MAILLAAGASSRLGAVKALLPLQGQDVAVRVLARRYSSLAGRCLVATGHHATLVEAALAGLPNVTAVRNLNPERGQLSSLQCALDYLSRESTEPDWFLFAPVDCFDIDESVLQPLFAAMAEAAPQTLLCIPEWNGAHGHPVAARWHVASRLLALDASQSARAVIHPLRPQTRYVQVGNGRFLRDIDTPADWQARLLAQSEATEGEQP